jgi:hypothetical protein
MGAGVNNFYGAPVPISVKRKDSISINIPVVTELHIEEWCLLGCYAVWLL